MPHPDHGVLAVHVVASETEMDQVDDHKAMDDDACRRVAEALMFATAMHHLKATNQVKSAVPTLLPCLLLRSYPDSQRRHCSLDSHVRSACTLTPLVKSCAGS